MGPPSKKRKLKDSTTEEVVFDPSARFDYLTGFHKRKVQRTKLAQEAAARRARQEKIDDRKKLREERKADLERHVKEINALLPSHTQALGADEENGESSNEDEGDGIPNGSPEAVDHEDEYIDEDKYTTVVVEEVEITRDGISKPGGNNDEPGGTEEIVAKAIPVKKSGMKTTAGKRDYTKDKKPKKKKKNFRYESPADRKLNRVKERARKSKAAKIRRGD